jgi:hypothetical protein
MFIGFVTYTDAGVLVYIPHRFIKQHVGPYNTHYRGVKSEFMSHCLKIPKAKRKSVQKHKALRSLFLKAD